MPELPEVETIRTQLSNLLPFEVRVLERSKHGGNLFKDWQAPFTFTIEAIGRRGKLLWFELKDGRRLYSHLGMSGSWIIGEGGALEKHAHLILSGHQGQKISFVDPRRFGLLALTHQGSEVEKKILKNLGPDLTDLEFNPDYFKRCIKKFPERKIKITLLDQKLFAGIGNYMASEICALAKIRPTRLCKNLTSNQIQDLYSSINQVVSGMVNAQGNTFQGGYRDAFGNDGGGLSKLVVFYQTTCGMCKKNKIKKITLAGRGTYYCPKCQK